MMKAQYTHTNTNPLNLVLRSTRFFFSASAGDLADDSVIVDCQAC